REHGARMEYERLLSAFVDRDAGQIAGHQVRRELHARKLQAERAGKGMRQGRFADAGHVFDQKMTSRKKTRHAIANLRGFAHDHRVKLVQKALEFLLCIHLCMTLTQKSEERDK